MRHLLVLLFISACASIPVAESPVHYQEPSFIHVYEREFKAYARAYQKNPLGVTFIGSILIHMDEDKYYGVSTDVVGYCETLEGVDYIALDATYWNNATAVQREILYFHEAGHCLIGRLHCDGYIKHRGKEIHESLMDSHVIDPWEYEHNTPYYINELFNGECYGFETDSSSERRSTR